MERVSSRQNAVVKRFRELARAADADHVLLDGEHLLEEALKSDVRVETAAFAERLAHGRLRPLVERARKGGARLLAVSEPVLAAMSPVQHPSGVVAIAERRGATLDAALAHPPQLVLLLSDIQDPGNVGAIVRAAEGCGATGIVAAEGTADPLGWKALRGGMGSTFRLPVAAGHGLDEALRAARARGIRILATTPRGGTPLPQANLRGPVAILLGGEGGGLPSTLVDEADERITIPMRAPVESLNVATAAALVVYEASRQRAQPLHPR
jgi:TrmH family RNA methyltransferase